LFAPRRHDLPGRAADLYDLLGAVELVCRALGLPPVVTEPVDRAPFHPGRAARVVIDGAEVGVVGELHPRVIEAAELPRRTLAGELRLDRLVAGGIRPAAGTMPSGLPGLRFDVAVVVDEDVPAAAVRDAVAVAAGDRLTKLELFDVFRGEQLGAGRKSLAYALRLDDAERQLTTEDEAAAISAIEAAAAQLGGHLRR
jgi:phenylalanyl-tRNA synthetase beta chain